MRHFLCDGPCLKVHRIVGDATAAGGGGFAEAPRRHYRLEYYFRKILGEIRG